VIAASGLALMAASQASMGAAFRVGQDEHDAPPELQRGGLHALTRNPIYVGSWTFLLGMTLWHPSALLLALCALVGLGIHGLVLAEEAFLRERFGATYAAYCAATPRYLGGARR
jgi:protein-S-isoprenylcysteine O-methyltransferase Ste14